MREILFRGKRTDNGTWAYGYLFCIWERTYLCWGTTNDVPNMKEVIPETVGQFTGLTDKNDKKIFEGDIVECVSGGEQAIISWLKYFACFGLSFDGWCCGFDDYDFSLNDFKVIGNIHDNPEILKNSSL